MSKPFTFIHTADLHIDSPLRGLSCDNMDMEATIKGAPRHGIETIVEAAIDRAVDFVIVAGDIYDGDWTDFSTGRFFVKQVERLNQAGIPLFLISGNHDAQSKMTKSLELPENATRLSVKKPETVRLGDLEVAIHGQGFKTQAVTENLAIRYPDPVPGHFNIGMLHTSLNGREGHEPYAPCTVTDLVDKGYDYWALGHIHLPEVVHKTSPWIIYPGIPQGRHIGEAGPRGYYEVSVDAEHTVTSCDFRVIAGVRWDVLSIDLADVEKLADLKSAVKDAILQTQEDEDLLALRLVFNGATTLHQALTRDRETLLEECRLTAELISEERLWIKDIKIKTSPRGDAPAELDPEVLTELKESIKTLTEDDKELPPVLEEMCSKLPSAVKQRRNELRTIWESDTSRLELIEAAEQLALEALNPSEED